MEKHNANEIKILFVMALFILSPMAMLWVALLLNDVVETEVVQSTEDWENEGNYMAGYVGSSFSFGGRPVHDTNLVADTIVMDYNMIEYWISYYIVFENLTGEAMRDLEMSGIKIEMEIYDDDAFVFHSTNQPALMMANSDGGAEEELKALSYQVETFETYTAIVMEAEISLVELNLMDANKILYVLFFSWDNIYGTSVNDKIYMTYEIYGKTEYVIISQTDIFGILLLCLASISALVTLIATNRLSIRDLEKLFWGRE